jgi:transcriptional regulator GlxA family with amidase domain
MKIRTMTRKDVNALLNVGIMIFDDVEVLDFAGPFEVFSVASEMHGYEYFNVFTVSENGKLVKTVNGLKVQPDYSFDSSPGIDILVLPGGVGTRKLIYNEKVLEWVRNRHSTAKVTCSVCSGALVLGKLGLLDNISSTTHHQVFDLLKEIAPATIIEKNKRYIDNGKIMTSAGISAGIDLALHIVKIIYGGEAEQKTVDHMEYRKMEDET